MSKKIKQHNAITEARYELSALEKNIFYMLLAELRDDDPESKRYYKINFKNLKKKCGKDLSVPELVKAAEGLVRRVYTIKKESGGEIDTSLISSVEYFPDENYLELGVGSMVRPYLIALKKDYTEFELDTALKLKSKYSKRMYEMISQHKDDDEFSISVEELKYRLAIIDEKTGKDTYPSWAMFANQVLKTPQNELLKNADLFFSYTLHKVGRKYTDITFHIKKQPVQGQLELGI